MAAADPAAVARYNDYLAERNIVPPAEWTKAELERAKQTAAFVEGIERWPKLDAGDRPDLYRPDPDPDARTLARLEDVPQAVRDALKAAV